MSLWRIAGNDNWQLIMPHGFTEDEFTGHLNLRLWLKIAQRARTHGRWFAVLGVIGVLLAGSEALFGLVIRQIVDTAVNNAPAKVTLFGLAFLGLVTAQCTAVLVFILVAGRCSTGVSFVLRRDAFAKLQSLEFAYFDRRPVGWLMARLTTDSQRLAGLLSWGLIDLFGARA